MVYLCFNQLRRACLLACPSHYIFLFFIALSVIIKVQVGEKNEVTEYWLWSSV
jgi:hypothetical protein